MTRRLEKRIAFVTGARRVRGIGRATALRLAREGAKVIISALRVTNRRCLRTRELVARHAEHHLNWNIWPRSGCWSADET